MATLPSTFIDDAIASVATALVLLHKTDRRCAPCISLIETSALIVTQPFSLSLSPHLPIPRLYIASSPRSYVSRKHRASLVFMRFLLISGRPTETSSIPASSGAWPLAQNQPPSVVAHETIPVISDSEGGQAGRMTKRTTTISSESRRVFPCFQLVGYLSTSPALFSNPASTREHRALARFATLPQALPPGRPTDYTSPRLRTGKSTGGRRYPLFRHPGFSGSKGRGWVSRQRLSPWRKLWSRSSV